MKWLCNIIKDVFHVVKSIIGGERLNNNDYELVIEMLKLELKECQQNSERFQFLKDWCGCMRVEYIAQLIRDEQDPDKFLEQIDKEIAILNKDKND